MCESDCWHLDRFAAGGGFLAIVIMACGECGAGFPACRLAAAGWKACPTTRAPVADAAHWLWLGNPNRQTKVFLRRRFTVDGPIENARLVATCDNSFNIFINGKQVLGGTSWWRLETTDVSKTLRRGENVIAVEAVNESGPAGFIAGLLVKGTSKKSLTIVTGKSWRAAAKAEGNWREIGFDDSGWKTADVLGPIGGGGLPWSGAIDRESLKSLLLQITTADFQPQPAEHVNVPPGFKAETVFHVPRSMGSWVSLAGDDHGRLIACDQGSAGLYFIKPGRLGDPKSVTHVEKLPVNLSSAQGLVWAFDSLYAVAAHGDQSGLHRLKDTDGDGLVDSDQFLMPIRGGGEHGAHGIVAGPDGRSLYVACGNHTNLPSRIAGSRIPTNWGEDLLLPRRWDANGHAAGRLAPGGWICKVDPNGKHCEIFSIGYRNQYDIAFNADGELFTYDADMEWDMGMPWYRPTRVCHATSGSEFGWRSGTGKWPPYYEDSLPPVINIGPGSPTGVVFGYGTKFPGRYQRALYILDWTYSTMYAIHLTPDGAGYRARKEEFVTGSPLPLTDVVVGADGALYFTVGGRGTQSAVYRVYYAGNESTAPVDGKDQDEAKLRLLRRRLETFHGRQDLQAVDAAWPHLGHEDRYIRYAAGIAIESQPVETWRGRALSESTPRVAIPALKALARQGEASDLKPLLDALDRIDFAPLDETGRLAMLRTYALAFIRLGRPDDSLRRRALARLEPHFPGSSDRVNAELARLLIYLGSPAIVEKCLALMDRLASQPEPVPDWGELIKRNPGYGGTVARILENMPPLRRIHYAFLLRNVKDGWMLDQRRTYFQFFLEAAKHPGGASYPGFLGNIREDALANCTQAERVALEPITGRSLTAAPVTVTPPQGPGRKWTKAAALEVLGSRLRGRNYNRGRNLFYAVSCAKCHRFNAEGGAIGPDLSTVGRKFSLPDLLDSILEPNKVISDQYGSKQVLTEDGRTLIGRVVEIGDELHVYTAEMAESPKVMKRSTVELVVDSKVSQMPAELIDTLNEEELKDLIAYLISAGNRRASVFRP